MNNNSNNTKVDLIDVFALAAIGAIAIGRDDIANKILKGKICHKKFKNEVEKSRSEAEG
jgi:hypothetical protein